MNIKSNLSLDTADIEILRELQQNARISNLELSDKVNLSATPCARRVKALEASGVIDSYVTRLNPEALGLSLTIHLAVTMDLHTPERFSAFESAITGFDEIISCSVVTGRSEDYLLKVVARDMQHYQQFLLGKLTGLPGVRGVHSSFELRSVIDRTALPLD